MYALSVVLVESEGAPRPLWVALAQRVATRDAPRR